VAEPPCARPAGAAEALRRDGYAVLEGFVDPVQLREVCAVAAEGPACEACERPNNQLVPLAWDHVAVARLLESPERVRRLRGVLGGGDLRWISAYLSRKAPASGPLWWHQDWWCWDHPVTYRARAPQVAVLCYATATEARTGALRVLPGSHRRSLPLHGVLPRAHAGDPARLAPDHPALGDHPDQVTLAARPGDAVVLDYRLLHGTHAHAGAAYRDCVILNFAPDWAALPGDVRAHLARHPAQPGRGDARQAPGWLRRLLPDCDGAPRDLPLSRDAPASFQTG
jgi:hypothetical protein